MEDADACDTGLIVRGSSPADAGAVAEIYNCYVLNTAITFDTEPITIEDMRGRMVAIMCAYPYLVAEYNGCVVGYCYAHEWKSRAAYRRTWETTVYVRPESCGMHVGRRLMDMLVKECRRLGCHSLIACITADNEKSISFHRRLGFEQVSLFREVGFKFGRYLDVADYELLL